MTLQVFPLEVTREWTSLRFAASWRSVPQHCCHNIGVSAAAVAACFGWCYWLSVRARAGAKQGIGWNRMEQHEIQCLFRNGRKLLANSTVLFFFELSFVETPACDLGTIEVATCTPPPHYRPLIATGFPESTPSISE